LRSSQDLGLSVEEYDKSRTLIAHVSLSTAISNLLRRRADIGSTWCSGLASSEDQRSQVRPSLALPKKGQEEPPQAPPQASTAAAAIAGRFERSPWGMTSAMNQRRATAPTVSVSQRGAELTADVEYQIPITEMKSFTAGICVLVLANMLCIGIEAEHGCFDCPIGDRVDWYVVESLFAAIFLIELVFRFAVEGPAGFFLGDALRHPLGFHLANCLDFLLILGRLLDTWVFAALEWRTPLKVISTLRVFRLHSFLRLVGRSRAFRDIWIVVSGLGDTLKAVVWTMLLLLVFVWCLAVCFTVSVGQSDDRYMFRTWDMEEYFGTVTRSCYTLTQVLTRDKWASAVMRPVMEVHPIVGFVSVGFLVIACFGMLNVLVGIIVESTLASAGNMNDLRAKEIQKVHSKVMASMKSIFDEADEDKSGSLDKDEMHRVMAKPHVRNRMQLLGIRKKDMAFLFDLLDEDTGSIPTNYFFRGCARISGPAMSRDLHNMSVDIARYIKWTGELTDVWRSTNDRLAELLAHMEELDLEIVKGDDDAKDPVLQARRARMRAGMHRGDVQKGRLKHTAWEGSAEGGHLRRRRPSMVRGSLGCADKRLSSAVEEMRVMHYGSNGGFPTTPPAPPPLPAHMAHTGVHFPYELAR